MTTTATKPASTTCADLERQIVAMGQAAKSAARQLAVLSTADKNRGLRRIADELETRTEEIIRANVCDLEAGRERGLSDAMLDRLRLDAARLGSVAEDVRHVAELPEPVGRVLRSWQQPNGLRLSKRSVPIGVIGIIYESRPNVTVDAAALCFKAGNATILRGGSEAFHSNQALGECIRSALETEHLPASAVQLVPGTDRAGVRYLAERDEALDLIIPRGGKGLIEAVVAAARMPVLKHYDGICHVYVDRAADLEMASAISHNAKVQRPSVCNAMETLLVHRDIAADFLPRHAAELRADGVVLCGDDAVRRLLPDVRPASEADWSTEYLSLELSIRVVDSVDQAIDHIDRYGSSHTEAIVTEDPATAQHFLDHVASSTVLWNASTRFADGGEFGFGAEIGISTDKLHARGPMGLEELTIYKYVVEGTGQVR